EARSGIFPEGHWQIGVAMTVLGRCLVLEGKREEGTRLLRKARDLLRATRLPGDIYRLDAEQALGPP
ncbi:MAG TPA: hypothetical protein VNH46_10870, partial [Gemmatimonadales bacterium]|nr:hypothetical protein [Gemmatimonadales bacterium]